MTRIFSIDTELTIPNVFFKKCKKDEDNTGGGVDYCASHIDYEVDVQTGDRLSQAIFQVVAAAVVIDQFGVTITFNE